MTIGRNTPAPTAADAEQTYNLHYVFVDGKGTPQTCAHYDAAIDYAISQTTAGAIVCYVYDDTCTDYSDEPGNEGWGTDEPLCIVHRGDVYTIGGAS